MTYLTRGRAGSRSAPKLDRAVVAATGALLAAGLLLYGPILAGLVRQWAGDDRYSHGFLVVPLAAWFAWEQRARFRAAEPRPAIFGLAAVIASLLVLATGVLGADLFLARVSMLGVIAGCVLYLYGWARLRVVAFSIGFLLLMIPLPAVVFNQLTLPLQLIASRLGETVIGWGGVPVLREGNILVLPQATLEVAQACSGIRSLVSLLTLAIAYGYFTERRLALRTVLALAALPLAILSNGLRVAWTGFATGYIGARATEPLFHETSGWLAFLGAFAVLIAVHRTIVYLAARLHPAGARASSAPAG